MSSRPRLVFASHYAPADLIAGAPIRTHRLLTGLSAEFETTLVTFEPRRSDGGRIAGPEPVERSPGWSIVTVPPPRRRSKRAAQLAGLASRGSYAWGRWQTPAYERALRDVVRRVRPDIVHFNDLGVALCGPVGTAVNVYGGQNVEHRVAQGAASVAAGARRVFAAVEAKKIRREETRVWRQMDLCLAVSELDAAAFRAGGARRVEVCLVGIDPVEPRPEPRRRPDEPLRLIFVGSNYHPNVHGLAWFIEHVLPAVQRAVPAILEVVGTKPDRAIEAPGVTYAGPVSSLDPHYDRAHVAIVPIFYGSGVRGKVVEAMAYGRPVVSTALGVEGLPVQPGEEYVHADGAEGFARALVGLAERIVDPADDIRTMLAAARLLAERHFWPTVVGDLVRLYRAAIEEPEREARANRRRVAG
jgi:glycosyltransferase involved in cell wall biosynthesis